MIEIREEPPTAEIISKYCAIPMAFRVESQFIPHPRAESKWDLEEKPNFQPYIKDYDNDESPHEWPHRFNLSKWVVLSAYEGDRRIGGAILAFDTPGIDMLEGRTDLAVIWDIRVHPDFRSKGIGSQLFEEAIKWAIAHGCSEIKIETQNINVSACKFYARMGCELRIVRPGAYSTLPDEIQFLWYKEL
ncbi:MAG TPA: GNAT family N-acetyltransferase [Candidatus Kapabacteria bacterium]|jgi:GNAT superfamily N-acetyltransferase|nr:GNAT family N-acetyltransferase [Candidatus Kapabacteria bacterium]